MKALQRLLVMLALCVATMTATPTLAQDVGDTPTTQMETDGEDGFDWGLLGLLGLAGLYGLKRRDHDTGHTTRRSV